MPIISADEFFGQIGSPLKTYGPVSPPSDDEAAAFIVKKAKELGKDPQEALRVWAEEGKGAWQSNYRKRGIREPSHGPMQLLSGGAGTGYPRGMGNQFQEETGLDPSDPRTWQEGTDYALNQASQGGWGQWYGAKRAGAGPTWDDAPQQQASMDPMRVSPPGKKKVISADEFMGQQSFDAAEDAPPPEPAADFFTPGAGEWKPPSAPVTAGGMFDQGMNQMLREGVPAAVGFPKAAARGIETADAWFRDKVGLQPGLHVAENLPLPATEDVKAAIGGVVPERKPQNVAEEYSGTVGEFLPSAAYGGGGLLRRGAQTVIPALLSETGGQIGRKISPQAETVGRVVGSLGSPTKPRAPKALANDTKALSQANYKAAEAIGLQIKGDSFYNFAQGLRNDNVLKTLKFKPESHPKLSNLMETIEDTVSGPPKQSPMAAMTGVTKTWTPGTMSLEQFNHIRQAARNAAKSANEDERRVGGHIMRRLDAYFDNLGMADVASGDPRKAAGHLREARKLWRVSEKEESLDTIMEVAKDNAGRFSVSGNENAIREGFRNLSKKIARDKREAARWTPDEIKIIRQLSRGWTGRDALKNIGRTLNNVFTQGVGLGGGSAMSYNTGDPNYLLYAGLAVLGGKAARAGAGALAGKRVRHLERVVRGGGKELPGGRGIIPVQPYTAYEDE
jgi:hypothetical protein